MKILAIETSCDETAIALLEASGGIKIPKFKIIKQVLSSQTKIHAHWGGVVPNLAKREHLKNLPLLFKKLKLEIRSCDLIAVTVGPGLEPALWTGVNFAKTIYQELKTLAGQAKNPGRAGRKLKLIGANHLEGHLYSFLLSQKTRSSKILKTSNLFPAIALIVSGGHTILLKMDSLTKRGKLGETRDDAVGEAFDKVARMLKLSYPGGPEIERLAKKGDSDSIIFPRPMINSENYDFSFSGLKTSVLYHLRDHPKKTKNYKHKADIAASFEKAAIDVLVSKTVRAVREYGAKSIMLSGGVASNETLRHEFRVRCKKLKVNFLASPKKFNTDNAVMIGIAAYINHLRNKSFPLKANGNLNL